MYSRENDGSGARVGHPELVEEVNEIADLRAVLEH